MTKEELFELADINFKVLKRSDHFVDRPEFYKFPLLIPDKNIKVFVIVNKGEIREIELHYGDGSLQTIRPE